MKSNFVGKISLLMMFLYSMGMIVSISYYGSINGGVFKYLLIGVCIFSTMSYCSRLYKGRVKSGEVLLFAVIFTMLFSMIMQLIFTSNLKEFGEGGRYSHTYLINTSLLAIVWFIVGYGIGHSVDYKKNNILSLIIIALLFFFVIPLVGQGYVIDYRKISDSVSHLSAGDGYYFVIVTLLAFATRNVYYFLIPLSVILFFMLAGRANLAIFIITIAIVEFFKASKKLKLIYMLFTLILLLFFMTIYNYFVVELAGKGMASKVIFAHGIENDGSFKARMKLLLVGMQSLKGLLFFGDVSSLVVRTGSLGGFIHNILSWIQYYGAVSFILLLLLIGAGIKQLFRDFKILKNNPDNVEVSFRMLILISGLIGVLLAKSGTYSLLMIGLGIYSGVYLKTRFLNTK